jgi:hypothetical protein
LYWGVREIALFGDISGTASILDQGDNHDKAKDIY